MGGMSVYRYYIWTLKILPIFSFKNPRRFENSKTRLKSHMCYILVNKKTLFSPLVHNILLLYTTILFFPVWMFIEFIFNLLEHPRRQTWTRPHDCNFFQKRTNVHISDMLHREWLCWYYCICDKSRGQYLSYQCILQQSSNGESYICFGYRRQDHRVLHKIIQDQLSFAKIRYAAENYRQTG